MTRDELVGRLHKIYKENGSMKVYFGIENSEHNIVTIPIYEINSDANDNVILCPHIANSYIITEEEE